MRTELYHISGSCLDSFDNYRDDFYKSYVLGEQTPYNIHMKFGKDHEDMLAETKYVGYDRQHKIEEYINGYKILGYCDFVNDSEVVEAKTKSGWWSENNIRNSWQFRIYNHYRGNKRFIIHQYNKLRQEEKIQDIGRDDPTFEQDILKKIKEVEEYLNKYNVKVLTYNEKTMENTLLNESLQSIINFIGKMATEEKIEEINKIKLALHEISPFKNEPVDCVIWEKNTNVVANDYNPNKVAPPEMELLEISIMNDGYTQPIVTWNTGENKQIIDGFHRHRVGMESKIVSSRILGYLPIVDIRKEQTDKNDRIASTIRHNRARGKHQIDAMSEIVIELKNRNWKNERIARELGMDQDEVLRLLQITGLQELFKDDDFSRAWNTDGSIDDYEDLTDQINNDTVGIYRATNTNDPDRIFHTFDKWECYKAGLYATTVEGMTEDECKQKYYDVLSDTKLFGEILEKIIVERKNSCEHYLTNKSMNRIAWLGQAAVCYHTGVPQKFCSGRQLLSDEQKDNANNTALIYLNKRMKNNNRDELDLSSAISEGRQVDIY